MARSPSALSGRFSVPRLALPACESPTAAAASGLTRSTRRVLSATPGARSPSPYGSPTRRSGTRDTAEPSALAELATLAGALGESLMAADLPAIVAHKRRADMRLSEAEAEEGAVPAGAHAGGLAGAPAGREGTAGVPLLQNCRASSTEGELPCNLHRGRPAPPCPAAELLEPPPGTAKKVLEAHRILTTARSLRSADSSASRTTDTEGAPAAARSARQAVDVEQVKCLLLQALVAALPLLEPAGAPGGAPAWPGCPCMALRMLRCLPGLLC